MFELKVCQVLNTAKVLWPHWQLKGFVAETAACTVTEVFHSKVYRPTFYFPLKLQELLNMVGCLLFKSREEYTVPNAKKQKKGS